MNSRWPQLVGVFSIALGALGTGACAGSTQAQGTLVYDYPAVYVDSPPSYAVYEPRVYYRGRYAYLVDDRWYYPTNRGWVVFREEPRELQRYRVRYREQPGMSYQHYPEYRHYDPPGYFYRASEYGTPMVPPPSPRYRAPAVPEAAPRYYAPRSPPAAPRYHAPAPPPPSHYRAAPPPAHAPPSVSPRLAPAPQAPRAVPPPPPPARPPGVAPRLVSPPPRAAPPPPPPPRAR